MKFPNDNGSGEWQLTSGRENHLLTNVAVWSHDGRWIYYDIRSDVNGAVFDGDQIRRVNVRTGETEIVWKALANSKVGVGTANPLRDEIVFIHGPEAPTDQWQYSTSHRRGVVVSSSEQASLNLDARNLIPPFTPGALRGGSHVHVFSGDGRWVSFTYEDHVLTENNGERGSQLNQRNVGVASPVSDVEVPKSYPRNHDGSHFSVLVTRTTDKPAPGSDEINRAYSDAWIGTNGYERNNGSRQTRALAFIGDCIDRSGMKLSELFVVDVPDDVTVPGDGPLEGTPSTRPSPPQGTVQRRLTFTANRRFPGLGDIRHWPRSSPDGRKIAFLMRDDSGKNQLWTIDPMGKGLRQLTRGEHSVESAFTFRCDGRAIACVIGRRICEVGVDGGKLVPLTRQSNDLEPSPISDKAVVYSPDGTQVAFTRIVSTDGGDQNQVFLVGTKFA